MNLDYDDLQEQATETAEKAGEAADIAEEATGSRNISPDEMTISDLVEMEKKKEELEEVFSDDSSGLADAITELAKDDEIRMGAKQLIMELKNSGNSDSIDGVKTSVENPEPVGSQNVQESSKDLSQNQTSGDQIVMTPDDMFNLTLTMLGNAVKMKGEDMTVEEMIEYVENNETLLKQEMKSLGGQ